AYKNLVLNQTRYYKFPIERASPQIWQRLGIPRSSAPGRLILGLPVSCSGRKIPSAGAVTVIAAGSVSLSVSAFTVFLGENRAALRTAFKETLN
ncbi:MAG: hypothetical protein LBQ14_12390, partial [Treponema sp.]|nr:hypothetical protein [Treponema sp.]